MGRPVTKLLKDERPDLAAQVVDKSLLTTLGMGSTKKIEWCCEKGHHWIARVDNRVYASNTRCPVCSGRLVVPGVNDLATVAPEIAKLCANPDDARAYTLKSNKKLLWRCEHGHEWTAPVSRLASGARCPYCSGRYPIIGVNDLATTHPELAAQLVDPCLATKLQAGTPKKVLWRCEHGHTWEASPYDRATQHAGCPYCSHHRVIPDETSLAVIMPEIAKHLLHPEQAYEITPGSNRQLDWVCERNPKHIWRCTVSNYRQGGCPYCANKRIIVGENDLATTHPNIAAQLVDQSLATKLVAGSGKRVEWRCEQGHTWTAPVYRRTGPGATGCPECANAGTSDKERDFCDVIRRLVPKETIVTNDQSYLQGRFELDIVLPDRSIAFEFNGCVWHSEKARKSRTYHRDKARMAHAAGLRLIQIWEDDWDTRRDVVIRAIAHKLGAFDYLPDILDDFDPTMVERIGARKLTAQRVSGSEARRFLNENHIQGAVTATFHYALMDDQGRIRALLSARSPRNNARMHRAPGEWEIQRYATRGIIPGGFTKLMRFAERNIKSQGYELTRWVSFSANDISDGSMYRTCGFTLDREVPPSYFYVGNLNHWVREPKEKYQRRRFRDDPKLAWNETWTEHDAALANGLYRIYDAGKLRWVKDV